MIRIVRTTVDTVDLARGRREALDAARVELVSDRGTQVLATIASEEAAARGETPAEAAERWVRVHVLGTQEAYPTGVEARAARLM